VRTTGTAIPRDTTAAFGPAGLDRRRAPRIPVPPGGPASVIGARLVSASPYGMLIESPVPMERDAMQRLGMVVARERVDVEARVVACRRMISRGKFVFGVGLEFTSIPGAVREKLRAALDDLAAARPAS
jgi:PilZ domain-containing protein